MAALTPVPKIQFFDANGHPLAGGKLYSYSAGTTTPLVTYTDQAATSANTNPVILDARGEASVWLGTGPYKLRLTTATDVDIWTVDDIYSEGALSMQELLSSAGSSLVGFIQSGTGATYRTVQSKLRDTVSVKDFGAVGDGVTDDTAAIQAAAASGSREVYFPAGSYAVTTVTLTNLSNLKLKGAGSGTTLIKATVTGAAAEPTLKINATTAVRLNIEDIGFIGNGLTGASGHGNAISIINTAGTGFAPQLLTLRDVYIEGFLGTGKDRTGASMPSAGIYGYLGTSANFDNVSVFSCAQAMVLNGYQKTSSYNFVADLITTRGLYLVNCENIDFFGGILNRCGSGGATDGSVVPQGCSNLNFYGVRLKDADPCHLNSRSTTYINRDMTFWGCDWNQTDGVNTMIDAGTGDSGLRIKGGRWKWINTTTAGVGLTVGNGPGGYQMTGLLVEDVAAGVGSGGTIANLVHINNSTGVVHAPRIRGLQFGDGTAAGSATTVTNGVHLSGIIDSPIIDGLNLHAATNYTITNAVNIDAPPGNIANPVIIAPVYRTTGGTITNQLVNTTGATVTQIASGITSSGNLRASVVSAGVAGSTTIGATTATTVGAAGAASALPANPLGYIIGHVGTTQIKIPYYNA